MSGCRVRSDTERSAADSFRVQAGPIEAASTEYESTKW